MATNNKPTPADRIRKVHEAIMRAKLTIPYDAPEQYFLSQALNNLECAGVSRMKEQEEKRAAQRAGIPGSATLFHDGGTD